MKRCYAQTLGWLALVSLMVVEASSAMAGNSYRGKTPPKNEPISAKVDRNKLAGDAQKKTPPLGTVRAAGSPGRVPTKIIKQDTGTGNSFTLSATANSVNGGPRQATFTVVYSDHTGYFQGAPKLDTYVLVHTKLIAVDQAAHPSFQNQEHPTSLVRQSDGTYSGTFTVELAPLAENYQIIVQQADFAFSHNQRWDSDNGKNYQISSIGPI